MKINGKIAAVILGRNGSTGFPGKNTMKILNKPAYEYAINAAQSAVKPARMHYEYAMNAL